MLSRFSPYPYFIVPMLPMSAKLLRQMNKVWDESGLEDIDMSSDDEDSLDED